MNVRTVTLGLPLASIGDLPAVEPRVRGLFDALGTAFAAEEIAVRTRRITLDPIGERDEAQVNQAQAMGAVRSVAEACDRLDVRWFNVPFDLTRHAHSTTLDALCEVAFEVVRRTPRAFVHLIGASGGQLSGRVAARASRFIKAVARLETSGYHNFRVGVGCNVAANTPFFPFAWCGGELGFSLGLEMPQEIMKVMVARPDAPLPELREALLSTLAPQVARIDAIATAVAAEHGLTFHGIDVSIAPFPEAHGSVAEIMERCGLEQYGAHGTLVITAFLTDILRELVRRTQIRTVGFNGVMMSLLEDEFMGRRNNAGTYSLDSLILYSTVCGCGVDMVPVPGDMFEEEIATLILDVAAASTVLGKPLGVRLLPIPMKQAHEFTSFHMDFLFNTRIKQVRNAGMAAHHLQGGPFTLSRKP
jgi:uncharacterized protein (UPF0210 family)